MINYKTTGMVSLERDRFRVCTTIYCYFARRTILCWLFQSLIQGWKRVASHPFSLKVWTVLAFKNVHINVEDSEVAIHCRSQLLVSNYIEFSPMESLSGSALAMLTCTSPSQSLPLIDSLSQLMRTLVSTCSHWSV